MRLVHRYQPRIQIYNILVQLHQLCSVVELAPRELLDILEVLGKLLLLEEWYHTFGQVDAHRLEVEPRVDQVSYLFVFVRLHALKLSVGLVFCQN